MNCSPMVAATLFCFACGDKTPTFPHSDAPMGVGSGRDTAGSPPNGGDTGNSRDSALLDTGDTAQPSDSDDSSAPADTGEPDGDEAAVSGPVFYPGGQIHSPLTRSIVANLLEIAARDPTLNDNVFMKIGASSTVSSATLYCFAGDNVNLGVHSHLNATLDTFLAGDADGSTSFDRDTEAARSGMSAGWAITGEPSPVESEYSRLQPRFALMHYGTNDMGLGSTYLSAMPGFYENMQTMIEYLSEAGVVPILTGISHRMDSTAANGWVPAYNAIIRGMAQQWQVPFIDMYQAMDPLTGYGLSGDGLHLNGYSGGACQLTEAGLAFGYPTRNLIVLESLDRVVRGMMLDDTVDPALSGVTGQGSPADPFVIHTLPFSDSQDTQHSPHRNQDVYTECGSDSDESGPEYSYELTLDESVSIRAVVMDRSDVDVDIHLLGEDGCIVRGNHAVEASLTPGTYTLVVDSWTDGEGEEQAGEYLLAIVTCPEGC